MATLGRCPSGRSYTVEQAAHNPQLRGLFKLLTATGGLSGGDGNLRV